jgi:hypothetical protein
MAVCPLLLFAVLLYPVPLLFPVRPASADPVELRSNPVSKQSAVPAPRGVTS